MTPLLRICVLASSAALVIVGLLLALLDWIQAVAALIAS